MNEEQKLPLRKSVILDAIDRLEQAQEFDSPQKVSKTIEYVIDLLLRAELQESYDKWVDHIMSELRRKIKERDSADMKDRKNPFVNHSGVSSSEYGWYEKKPLKNKYIASIDPISDDAEIIVTKLPQDQEP